MSAFDAVLQDLMLYQRSRVILTAAELDLFTRLDGRPAPAETLAAETGGDPRAVTRLLDCLITFGLLDRDHGRYRPTEGGALLSGRHPASLLPMALHQNAIWRKWSGLTGAVKRGTHPELAAGEGPTEAEQKAFIDAMHAIGEPLAREIAAALDLRPYRCLLDVGGGSGTYTLAFLERNPAMRAVIFDLESVIPRARERIAKAGCLDRVQLAAGDFHEDDLPRGADLVLLSAIIHQGSPQENLALFRKIQGAMEPGGTLLIRDHFMDATRTRPPRGALFALTMLACTPRGDTYTLDEVREGLEEAGFTRVELIRTGERMDGLVRAVRPA